MPWRIINKEQSSQLAWNYETIKRQPSSVSSFDNSQRVCDDHHTVFGTLSSDFFFFFMTNYYSSMTLLSFSWNMVCGLYESRYAWCHFSLIFNPFFFFFRVWLNFRWVRRCCECCVLRVARTDHLVPKGPQTTGWISDKSNIWGCQHGLLHSWSKATV